MRLMDALTRRALPGLSEPQEKACPKAFSTPEYCTTVSLIKCETAGDPKKHKPLQGVVQQIVRKFKFKRDLPAPKSQVWICVLHWWHPDLKSIKSCQRVHGHSYMYVYIYMYIFRTRVAAHTAPQWQEICPSSASMQTNWEVRIATRSENELQITYYQARLKPKLENAGQAITLRIR